MTLFKHCLEAIEENAEQNDLTIKESGWNDAHHILEVYESSFHGDCSEEERDLTIKLLDIILENPDKESDCITEFNQKIYGIESGNNDLPVQWFL